MTALYTQKTLLVKSLDYKKDIIMKKDIDLASKKAVLEEMKQYFDVSSIEQVAELLGFSKNTAATWRNRGPSQNAILKFEAMKSKGGHPLKGIFQKIEESAVDASAVSPEDQEFLQLFKDYAPSKYIDKVKKDLEEFKKQIDGGN